MLLVPWSARAQPVATPAATPAPSLAPWSTSADLPPPPARTAPATDTSGAEAVAARHRRLLDVLAWEEDRQRSSRRTVFITGAVLGGVSLGLGAALSARDRSADETAGAFVGSLGVGLLLGVGIGALLPTPWGTVLDARDAAAAENLPPELAVARIERTWRDAAENNLRAQRIGAWALMISGGALSLTSVGFLMGAVDGLGRSDARGWGTLLLYSGSILTMTGAALLYALDPVEHSWEVYHRTAPSLGIAPLTNGAAATLTGTF